MAWVRLLCTNHRLLKSLTFKQSEATVNVTLSNQFGNSSGSNSSVTASSGSIFQVAYHERIIMLCGSSCLNVTQIDHC
jgi:hypothetical protein